MTLNNLLEILGMSYELNIMQLNDYYNDQEYKKVIRLGESMLHKYNDDHYLLTVVGSSYNEIGKHQQALKYSKKAYESDCKCPLVLWDYACALDLSGSTEKAIQLWKKLVSIGVNGIVNNECGEGVKWAKSTVLDSLFRIARCYAYLNDSKNAKYYYTKHLKMRKRGLPSLYSLKEVNNDVKELELSHNLLKSYKNKNYKKAIILGKSLLKLKNGDHHTNAIVGICYKKIDKLKMALHFLELSYRLEPNCPFVLWNYGNALKQNNQKNDAIRIWKKLIDAYCSNKIPQECDEGNTTASIIVNTYYDLGVTYNEIGNVDLAKDNLNIHMSKRKRGLPDLAPLVEVKKVLSSVNTK